MDDATIAATRERHPDRDERAGLVAAVEIRSGVFDCTFDALLVVVAFLGERARRDRTRIEFEVGKRERTSFVRQRERGFVRYTSRVGTKSVERGTNRTDVHATIIGRQVVRSEEHTSELQS